MTKVVTIKITLKTQKIFARWNLLSDFMVRIHTAYAHASEKREKKRTYCFVVFHVLLPSLHIGTVPPGSFVAEVTFLDVVVKDDGHTSDIRPTDGHTLQDTPDPQCPVPVGPRNHLPWAVGSFDQPIFFNVGRAWTSLSSGCIENR